MNLELFILGGYGQFVWPAFAFTFLNCLVLYLKTRKELKKQEEAFFSNNERSLTSNIKIIVRFGTWR